MADKMKACVDIGGTKVAVSLAREREFLVRLSEPTVKVGGRDALAQQIIRMVDAACAEQKLTRADIEAVGVSACGPFVIHEGMIELAAPNICGGMAGPARGLPNDWMSALLEASLRVAFGSVRVENDAIAALEAERHWGALQGLDHCAYLTWSTGIGLGLCVDGRILRGKNGNAGHAGHMYVSDHSDRSEGLCGCGNTGDVEGLVAGNAIARRWGREASDLFTAARAGERQAIAQVDDLCRVLGRTLYNVVVTLDLQRVSLGGSVFWHQRDILLPKLQAVVSSGLPALTSGVMLVEAGLGLQLGDYAALALVM